VLCKPRSATVDTAAVDPYKYWRSTPIVPPDLHYLQRNPVALEQDRTQPVATPAISTLTHALILVDSAGRDTGLLAWVRYFFVRSSSPVDVSECSASNLTGRVLQIPRYSGPVGTLCKDL